jgi:hypothetical protein
MRACHSPGWIEQRAETLTSEGGRAVFSKGVEMCG